MQEALTDELLALAMAVAVAAVVLVALFIWLYLWALKRAREDGEPSGEVAPREEDEEGPGD